MFSWAIILWILGFSYSLQAWSQTPLDSLFQAPPQVAIPSLPNGTEDLEVDEEGNLFLLSPAKHRVQKYFASTRYDSCLTIGGKGLGEEGFNHPSKIVVPNRQKLFILDFDNRRIALLNTNLKVVEDVNFLTLQSSILEEEEVFINPISFTAGPFGDMYILNQEDIKVYKLNASGQFELSFGGVDYGAGSLRSPDDVLINGHNQIIVTDSTHQEIKIFDLFGTFQYTLPVTPDFRWKKCAVWGESLIFFNENSLHFRNLFNKRFATIHWKWADPIIDISVGKDKFYLLTRNQVVLYPIQ